MDKSVISDKSIRSLVEMAPLDKEQKEKIIGDLPYMDEDARIFLLDAIKDIFIIEGRKEEAIEKVKEL